MLYLKIYNAHFECNKAFSPQNIWRRFFLSRVLGECHLCLLMCILPSCPNTCLIPTRPRPLSINMIIFRGQKWGGWYSTKGRFKGRFASALDISEQRTSLLCFSLLTYLFVYFIYMNFVS